MANVGTLTANLVAQTNSFNRPLEQAQKRIEQFNQRMEKVQKSLDTVSKAGQKAGLAFAALTGAIAVGVKNAAAYGDELLQMSMKTGIAVEELQEMQYIAKQTGFEFNNLQQMTSSLAEKVMQAEASGGEMAAVFNKLGINVRDNQGNIRGMSDLFDDTIMSLSRMENSVERNAMAVKIFGEEGRNIIPLLEAGQGEIERMRREARDLGLVMGEAAVRDMANFHKEVQTVGQRAVTAGQNFFAQFIPAFRVVLDWVNKGIDWFQNLSQEQMDNIKRWVTLAAAILGLVFVFGLVAKAASVVIGIFKTLNTVFLAIKGVIGVITGAFVGFSAGTILVIGLIIAALVGLYLAWKNNWFGIRDIITNVWENHIKPILDVVIEWGAKTLKTAWNWAVEAAGVFWEWLKETAWPWISKNLKTAWNWSVGVLGTFWDWLTGKALPWIQGEIDTFWNWSLDVFGEFWQWLVDEGWPLLQDTIGTAWEWSIKALGVFWEWLRDKAWPWLSKVAETAWTWSFKFLGAYIEWLVTKAWPFLIKAGLTTWKWTFKLLGKFIIWLIEDAFPFIGGIIGTTWEWTFGALGKLWEWLTDKAIPWIGDTLTTSWEWTFKAFGKLWEWIEKGADWIGDTVTTTIEFAEKGLSGIQKGIDTVAGWFGFQRGGILPGMGGPDQFPALLAPGEAIIPGSVWRRGLGAVAEWFREMGVPGFQEGGIPGEAAGNGGNGGNGGAGAGLLASLFPDLSASIKAQGGLVKSIGNVVGNIPQMIINGLFSFFDGLIGVVEKLATTILGEEEAQRITGTLKGWQDEMKRFLGTLGFFEGEFEETANGINDAAKDVGGNLAEASTEVKLFSEILGHAWAAIQQNVPILSRAIEMFQTSIQPIKDEIGTVIRDAMTPMQALAMVGLDMVMQSETFARILEIANPILEAFVNALGMLLDPLLPIVQVLSDILVPVLTALGQIIGSLLVPAMQLLFPIVKSLGIVLLTVAKAVGSVWNALLDLVSLIPFVNLRKYKVNLEDLTEATERLKNTTWDEARARAENTKAIEESTKAMVNVPSVFRIALRRAQSTGETMPITPMQTGGIVTRPTIGLIGESGPEAVIPLGSDGASGRGITIEVNINGPLFGMNDFRRAIEEAISRAARSAGLAEYGTVVKFT